MYNPFLMHPCFVYTRLLAITWHANPILQPAVFTSAAGDKLRQCIEAHPNLPVVLNCVGLSTIEDHALGTIREYFSLTDRCVAFIINGNNEQLIKEIQSELRDVKICVESVGEHQVLFFGKNRSLALPIKNMLDDLVVETEKIERDFINQTVRDSYRGFAQPKRLDSTPLWATGVLNARSLISDPKSFVWVSILLTDLFQKVIEEARPITNRLLAVSLRGSPFAAAIRVLAHGFSPTLEIIDHIGPKHEVLEGYIGKNNMEGGEYILIGDFVIGGTEIKIARAYAMARGACLKNAISIGSYLAGNDYDQNVSLRSLVSIPSIVPQLTYEFHARGVQQ